MVKSDPESIKSRLFLALLDHSLALQIHLAKRRHRKAPGFYPGLPVIREVDEPEPIHITFYHNHAAANMTKGHRPPPLPLTESSHASSVHHTNIKQAQQGFRSGATPAVLEELSRGSTGASTMSTTDDRPTGAATRSPTNNSSINASTLSATSAPFVPMAPAEASIVFPQPTHHNGMVSAAANPQMVSHGAIGYGSLRPGQTSTFTQHTGQHTNAGPQIAGLNTNSAHNIAESAVDLDFSPLPYRLLPIGPPIPSLNANNHSTTGDQPVPQVLGPAQPRDPDIVNLIFNGIKSGMTEPPKAHVRVSNAEHWDSHTFQPTMTQVRYNQPSKDPADDSVDRCATHRAGELPRLTYPRNEPPAWLHAADAGYYTPTFAELVHSLPLVELYRMPSNRPSNNGVLKIRNVPYTVTKGEILSFMGSQAHVLPQPAGTPYHAVHIMIERETGKTMNAFIEFPSEKDMLAVERHIARRHGDRSVKIGDRCVIVERSSIEELMREMFPRAQKTRWLEITPVVDVNSHPEYYPDVPSAGFQGFLHQEELALMAKHMDDGQRSSFISRAQHRIYEVIISLLHKYPWYAFEYVMIKERRHIFDLCLEAVKGLMKRVAIAKREAQGPNTITEPLLHELVIACLTCPGFSETQKAMITHVVRHSPFSRMVDERYVRIHHGSNTPYSTQWPFTTLVPIPNTDPRHLAFYAKIFFYGTLHERTPAHGLPDDMYFGFWRWAYLADPQRYEDLTLHDFANVEGKKIVDVLRVVLGPLAGSPRSEPSAVPLPLLAHHDPAYANATVQEVKEEEAQHGKQAHPDADADPDEFGSVSSGYGAGVPLSGLGGMSGLNSRQLSPVPWTSYPPSISPDSSSAGA